MLRVRFSNFTNCKRACLKFFFSNATWPNKLETSIDIFHIGRKIENFLKLFFGIVNLVDLHERLRQIKASVFFQRSFFFENSFKLSNSCIVFRGLELLQSLLKRL